MREIIINYGVWENEPNLNDYRTRFTLEKLGMDLNRHIEVEELPNGIKFTQKFLPLLDNVIVFGEINI